METPTSLATSPLTLGYDSKSKVRDDGKMTDLEFEEFVKDNQDGALRLAYSYLKDWEEARDAVQDGFVKAYNKMAGFRGDASRRTWFYRLMVNLLKDKLRRRKVRSIVTLVPFGFSPDDGEGQAMDPIDDTRGPSQRTEDTFVRKDFDEALTRLPKRQREVASLHLASGLTLRQSSEVLGISEGAAKAHYFRAVRSLRKELSAWREE